jgi:hypothetical protein
MTHDYILLFLYRVEFAQCHYFAANTLQK